MIRHIAPLQNMIQIYGEIEGISTFTNDLQSPKAPSPIEITEEGICTYFNDAQL